MWRKRAGLAAEGRPVFVQPLSLTSFDSSPSRGASGETVHFAGTAKASPTRGGGQIIISSATLAKKKDNITDIV